VENSKIKELQIFCVLFYDEERVEVENNSFLRYFMRRKVLRWKLIRGPRIKRERESERERVDFIFKNSDIIIKNSLITLKFKLVGTS
jgi:hypothetical protein